MNLDERARRAAASVREQAATVDAQAVLERIRGSQERRPRWLLPAGAAAVAVALVITVVTVVIPRVDTGPVIDPAVPGDETPREAPTAPPTTEPTEPVSGAVSFEWQRVDAEAFRGPGDDRIRAIDQAGGATVAVGRRADGPGIWWRDPQRTPEAPDAWRQVAQDLCGEASCELHDVTTTGDGFVVVGTLDGLPKIWRSDDGLTWKRIDLERRDPGTAGETELTAVVALGANEVIAFGEERLPDGGSRPVVFTSADGETWTEAPVDFAFEEAGAHVVDAGPAGAVLQIGDGTSLLVETDGIWAPRDLEGDEFNIITTFVHAIAPAADGGWMVGSVWTPDGQDGRVWRSDDGETRWTPMPGDLGGPGDQHVTSVAIGGGVVVGYETDAEGQPSPVAWRLNDGLWSRLPGGTAFNDPGAMLDAVQIDGHSAIVVGTAGGGGDPNSGAVPADAAVWTVTTTSEGGQTACSAADQPPVTGTAPPGLPDPVTDIRRAVLEAAVACDYAALETYALDGPNPFTYSFGGDGAPAAFWRREEERGDQPMLELVRLLQGPWATVDTEDLGTVHVWPPEYATDESYLGYRVGITQDGDWVFFVAGD